MGLAHGCAPVHTTTRVLNNEAYTTTCVLNDEAYSQQLFTEQHSALQFLTALKT